MAGSISGGENDASQFVTEFMMVRARAIEYLQEPAIAIYFQNMTQHINQLCLESEILDSKNRAAALESYTSTISHEFRTPLSTCLMFLDQMLLQTDDKEHMRVMKLIISQLNILLCLVNDILDIKQIQGNAFEPKVQEFAPLETLKFIIAMFQPQSEIQGTQLSYEMVSSETLLNAFEHGHDVNKMEYEELPEFLKGDNLRLQQILINMTKNALKFSIGGKVRLIMAYDKN